MNKPHHIFRDVDMTQKKLISSMCSINCMQSPHYTKSSVYPHQKNSIIISLFYRWLIWHISTLSFWWLNIMMRNLLIESRRTPLRDIISAQILLILELCQERTRIWVLFGLVLIYISRLNFLCGENLLIEYTTKQAQITRNRWMMWCISKACLIEKIRTFENSPSFFE